MGLQKNQRLGWLVASLLTVVLVGSVGSVIYARGRWWLPPLASQAAQPVDLMFLTLLGTILAVFIIVHIFLVFVVHRFGTRGPARGIYWHENHRLEFTWTIIIAGALVGFLIMGGTIWAGMQSPPASFGPGAGQDGEVLTVDITARQFAWEMTYPHADDLTVANELVLPVGEPVRLRLQSEDVIHSFFVPNFRIKMDTVPGRQTELWLQPSETGEYEAACAELCGVGHFAMRARVAVVEKAAFEQWLAQQSAAAAGGQ